jgi:CRP-like cAMP-binding protein
VPKENLPEIGNLLLASLPARDRKRLLPKLERVEMPLRKLVYEANQLIDYVYFPEEGVISLVSELNNGTMIEIGTVGKEGMIGIPVFLGAVSNPLKAFAQVPGRALRMKTADLKRELGNGTGLHRKLHLYTQALFTQLSQSVVCNRLHSIEQRCARWLLTTADRVDKPEFQLTQAFLAQMLGVRRASVNPVLQSFQKKGMLQYRQGKMVIKNRDKLERAACECYRIVHNEYRKLTEADK